MTDPITITIITCAALALVHALWPVITGNPEWLRDRRSELAAAAFAALFVAFCFAMRPVQTIEKPIAVYVKPDVGHDAKVAAEAWRINMKRNAASILERANARLYDAAGGGESAADGVGRGEF